MGNRSVVIGATDAYGNTILRQPGAYGYAAKAGPNSIAVGAFAGAGGYSDIDNAFGAVREFIEASGNAQLLADYNGLVEAFQTPGTDRSTLGGGWPAFAHPCRTSPTWRRSPHS